MILVRHGLMIVGDTIGGKTSAFKVLSDALGDLEKAKLMDEHRVRYIMVLLINYREASEVQVPVFNAKCFHREMYTNFINVII